jgi:hypothetical protein
MVWRRKISSTLAAFFEFLAAEIFIGEMPLSQTSTEIA